MAETIDPIAAPKAEVQKRLERIAAIDEEVRTLEEHLQEAGGELLKKVQELQVKVKKAEDQIAFLSGQLRDQEPEATQQIEMLRAERAKVEGQIKSLCHALPVKSLMKSGLKLQGSGFSVSVSRASVRRQFKVPELLAAHPEIRDLSVEEDPLFELAINEGVLDRLVAQGTIPEKLYEPFMTVVKEKAPQVSITALTDDTKS